MGRRLDVVLWCALAGVGGVTLVRRLYSYRKRLTVSRAVTVESQL